MKSVQFSRSLISLQLNDVLLTRVGW